MLHQTIDITHLLLGIDLNMESTPLPEQIELPFDDRAVVEITLTPDADRLVASALEPVASQPLKTVLQQLLDEPEVRTLVTRNLGLAFHPSGRILAAGIGRYPICQLRRAGGLASFMQMGGMREREVLYAATVLQGIQDMLARQLADSACTPRDAVLTMVRPSLHYLDEEDPRGAYLLRLVLGWGNDDESDADVVPHLQSLVRRALRTAGLSAPVIRHNRVALS